MRQQLTHANTSFTVGCFGNLFTFSPYRGEGYGARVLQAATIYLRQRELDLAALFCDPALIPFYAQHGWELTHSSTHVGRQDDYTVEPASRLMLFLSAQGQAVRQAFDEEALYVEWTW